MKTIKHVRFEKDWLQKHIEPNDVIADFGCGIMGFTRYLECKIHYGFEVVPEFIDVMKNEIKDKRIQVQQFDISTDMYKLEDKFFDVSIAIDVVEHLEKDISLKVIKEIERVTKRKVVIFTPLGFWRIEDGKPGSWGAGHPQYMKHRCGFEHEDFWGMGYDTIQRIGGDYLYILAIKEL